MHVTEEQMLSSSKDTYQYKNKKNPIKEFQRLCREYIYSYVYWMSVQNDHFCETLTSEEITNYFFNGLIHPLWFRIYITRRAFIGMVRIDGEIRKYIASPQTVIASENSDYTDIIPKKDANYIFTEGRKKYRKASKKQIEMVKQICTRFGISAGNWELSNLTVKDVDDILIISKLVK